MGNLTMGKHLLNIMASDVIYYAMCHQYHITWLITRHLDEIFGSG